MPLRDLSTRLGRADLAGIPADRYLGTSGGFQAVESLGVSITRSALNIEGRLTASVLLLMLTGLVGFYLWTRNIQA